MAFESVDARSKRLSAEVSSKLKGTVMVSLDSLLVDPKTCPDPKNVGRLAKIFNSEGCDRMNPRHFIPGNVQEEVLQASLRYSGITLHDLRSTERRHLRFPPGCHVECLHGKHRVAALRKTKHEKWWTVELYVEICSYPTNSLDANRWRSRLTTHKNEILRRLLKHPTLSPALRRTMQIPGLRRGLQLGVWSKVLADKYEEEVLHGLQHVYEVWKRILGSGAALEFVDGDTVREFESRAPGASQRDYFHVSEAIRRNVALRRLTDDERRQQVLSNLQQVDTLIPSMYTLQKDFKYVRQCTSVMRKLILGSSRFPMTVQAIAFHAFQSEKPSGHSHEAELLGSMKCLYLHIMQNLVELSGENTLLEDDEAKQEARQYDQTAWHRLAIRARDLGFASGEITRHCQLDPDIEAAKRIMLIARPALCFAYGSNFEKLANIVAGVFKEAQPIQLQGVQPALTTSSLGEPLARRYGRQYSGSYAQNRQCLTVHWFTCPIEKGPEITSLFVRRSVFHTFWGPHGIHQEDSVNASMSDTSMSELSEVESDAEEPNQPNGSSAEAPVEDNEMEDAPALSQLQKRNRPRMARKRQQQNVGATKGKIQKRGPDGGSSTVTALQRSLQVSKPAPQETGLGDRSSALTTFIPGSLGLSREAQVASQAVLRLDDREMTILIRRNGDWVDAKPCRRRSIVEGIAQVERENEGREWFLFDKDGRGIKPAVCPTLPDDFVCLNTETSVFPAQEIL
ncbi:uncharacterized protein VDAG_04903 [Verticillium dahliae VdLs.17]|uniref:Uncharacterized protein n=1 Tax=Verticillium dahliae (strain VdLs.17 / ATCC MYA-4575 / FGSC 10137) TaxID=498257 RepID=G2X3B8_VERDV|nr:uncharacterized protein VDAG_04903 [Verticillium dahliae VdLs.17]EGY23465.1 hypothetical protein VDAG_04903 [Verticillium dahliae VdLs.17]KAH6708525.1 hypothetical protein EV126DRAFT_332484 [Verticillium dahliae]